MKNEHLSTDQLIAIRNGETVDAGLFEHLATCSKCRRQLDDSRWLAVLGDAGEGKGRGRHLLPDEIEAYRTMALSTSRAARVERHLRECSRCLALYQRERSIDETTDYPTTPKNLLEKARASFRSKKRWLGTVLVTGLDKGPTAILMPARRVASGRDLFAGDSPYLAPNRQTSQPADETGHALGRHVDARRRRLYRALRGQADRLEEPQTRDSFPMAISSGNLDAGHLTAHETTAGSPPSAETLCIDAGDYQLHVIPRPRSSNRLTLQLVSPDGTRPIKGVLVRMRGPQGERFEGWTSARGRVRVQVVEGQSRVEIGVEPAITFSLHRVD